MAVTYTHTHTNVCTNMHSTVLFEFHRSVGRFADKARHVGFIPAHIPLFKARITCRPSSRCLLLLYAITPIFTIIKLLTLVSLPSTESYLIQTLGHWTSLSKTAGSVNLTELQIPILFDPVA